MYQSKNELNSSEIINSNYSNLYYICIEIISSEITSWDSTIRFYKKSVELLNDLDTFFSKTQAYEAPLEKWKDEFALYLKVYEKIYEIIGDSTQKYLTNLGVPDIGLLTQLNLQIPVQTINEIESQLHFTDFQVYSAQASIEGDNSSNEDLIINDEYKMQILCHALINMIGCEQFFTLCKLRKQAQAEYEKFIDFLKITLNVLPAEFNERTSKKYKFEGGSGFEIDAAAIIQRFVKYKLFGKELIQIIKQQREKEKNVKHLISIGNILQRLGAAHALWDNKARHISEKADPHKVSRQDDRFQHIIAYKKSLIEDKEKVDNDILDIEQKIKKLESPYTSPRGTAVRENKRLMLVRNLQKQLSSLEILREGQQKAIRRLNEISSTMIRNEFIEANQAEKNIKFHRSEAAVLIQLFYKEHKIPLLEFERNIPSHPPYKPETTLMWDERCASAPTSPRSPRSPLRRLRSITTNSVEGVGPSHFPESPNLKKSLWSSLKEGLKDGAHNVKVTMKKQNGGTIIIRKNNPFEEPDKNENNHPAQAVQTTNMNPTLMTENLEQSSVVYSNSSRSPVKETAFTPAIQDEPRRAPSIVERFFAQMSQQQSQQTKRTVDSDELEIASCVQDKINNIEKILKKGERMSLTLEQSRRDFIELEKEFKNYQESENGSTSLSTNKHVLFTAQNTQLVRGRAKTAPSSNQDSKSHPMQRAGKPPGTPWPAKKLPPTPTLK